MPDSYTPDAPEPPLVSDPAPAGERTPFHASVDWAGRQNTAVRRLLNWLERISLALEAPIGVLVRDPQFNPLYHTGTITALLLLVILLTGIYLTMFYQFGFTASYDAVAKIEANFVGRIVRAVHRYASGAVVITALLHGWRTFFQDRFRGPRWLAWVSGVVMAAFVWAIGVTGYWLIWDERAGVINQTFIDIWQSLSIRDGFLVNYLTTEAAGTGWIFVLLVLTAHLGLSALVGLFFWLHVKRLSRPKLLPPRYWMWAVAGLLAIVAILVPVGMLPPINPAQLPGEMPVDLFFLFYLPAALNRSPLLVWGGAILLVAILSAVPWLLVRRPLPPIRVNEDRCTGCTLCAADCPYKAIEMIPRTDGKRHKYVAKIDPGMCVSCGICIGTCQPLALTLGEQPPEPLWRETIARVSRAGERPVKVIFTCERHAFQGARPYLRAAGSGKGSDAMQVTVIPLTCVGMVHPDLLAQTLEAGAAEVQIVGCPPEDCSNREGNLWLEERLARSRLPRLKRAFAEAPIKTAWLPPNEFGRALRSLRSRAKATAYRDTLSKASLRGFFPALVLLAAVLALQIWLSKVPYRPFPADQAVVEIALDHRSGYPVRGLEDTAEPEIGLAVPTWLVLEVDGEIVLDETYAPRGKWGETPVFEQISLPSGTHHLRLTMSDLPGQSQPYVLFDDTVTLAQTQVLALNFEDARTGGDPAAGESLYYETSLGINAGCRICHSLEPDMTLVGPSFAGVATRAAGRVPGMTAEEYLRQSILEPDAYVVEGFSAGQMVPDLGETLTEEEIDDLVAFLMTLR